MYNIVTIIYYIQYNNNVIPAAAAGMECRANFSVNSSQEHQTNYYNRFEFQMYLISRLQISQLVFLLDTIGLVLKKSYKNG